MTSPKKESQGVEAESQDCGIQLFCLFSTANKGLGAFGISTSTGYSPPNRPNAFARTSEYGNSAQPQPTFLELPKSTRTPQTRRYNTGHSIARVWITIPKMLRYCLYLWARRRLLWQRAILLGGNCRWPLLPRGLHFSMSCA